MRFWNENLKYLSSQHYRLLPVPSNPPTAVKTQVRSTGEQKILKQEVPLKCQGVKSVKRNALSV